MARRLGLLGPIFYSAASYYGGLRAMQLRIIDYNSQKPTALQQPLYTPVYNDESSSEVQSLYLGVQLSHASLTTALRCRSFAPTPGAPAMSAERERVFSLSEAMCSPRRNKLNAESIYVCQCLRSRHCAGIIDDLFATVGDSKPPDTGEDGKELAQAFEGLEWF